MTLGLALWLFTSIFIDARRFSFDRVRIGFGILAALFLSASLIVSEVYIARMERMCALDDGVSHGAEAVVEEVRYEKDYASSYVLHVRRVDEKETAFDILWEIPKNGALAEGNEISFSGLFQRITGEYEGYHRSQGVFLEVSSEDFLLLNGEEREKGVFERLRVWIATTFAEKIGGDAGGYATALITGDRSGLDAQTRLAYQRLGISHLIAISGLHFSIIIGGFAFLLRWTGISLRVQNLILLLIALMFALICGFSGSVARAAIMFCLYYLMATFEEQHDSLTALTFAAACIVTVSPYSAYDAGLWLSVFSTLGILIVSPPLAQRFLIAPTAGRKLVRYLLITLTLTMTAAFFTMPIVYALYGGISLIAPLTNLIFIPVSQLILYLLVALALLGWIPYLSDALGLASELLINGTNAVAEALSDLRGIYFIIRYPFADYILIALVLGTVLVLFFGKARLRWLFAVFSTCTLAFVICFSVHSERSEGDSCLHLLSDGNSEVLLIVDDGEVLLADITTGGRSVPKAAVNALADYYRGEIDTYLITHIHANHAGTLKTLADTVKLHRVLIPEPRTPTEKTNVASLRSALDGACEVEFYRRDGTETVSVGDTVVSLPRYETLARSTHPVISFSGECGNGERWVYCGASSMEIFETWDIVSKCGTVILGSHGPKETYAINEECFSETERLILTDENTKRFLLTRYIDAQIIVAEEEYTVRFHTEAEA